MIASLNANVQLLAALVDFDDEDESEYRFLVDGQHVKYVTVDPGVLPKDDRTFAPVLLPLLPPFPLGHWNEGHISKDQKTGRLFFTHTVDHHLPGVQNIWHPICIDHLELKRVANSRIRQNIHRVTHALFDRPVLAKCAEFPWQMQYYEKETTAYEWIQGHGIGPEFLGYVTEAGRVIGFILEYVDGARTAGPDDLPACQRTLAKLHALGILHGDINRHNFLIRDDMAVLVDFETAQRCIRLENLAAEYERLETSLRDPSNRGGVGIAYES